jgi:hypothetical protein
VKYQIDWIDKPAEVLECDGMGECGGRAGGGPLVYRFWRGRAEQAPILLVNAQAVHSVRLVTEVDGLAAEGHELGEDVG